MTRRVRPLLPYAEAALVGLTLATALGFWRLFDNINFFPRLAAFGLGSHAIALVARRRGLSLPIAAVLSIVGAVVVTGIALYPSTTLAGIPTTDTIAAIRDGFGDLWGQFQEVKAPTPVTVPFLLAAGLGLWWAAFVADWAAFRLWVPFESIVPASTVFIFASLFAADRGRSAATGLFLAAAIGFLLIHRITRQQSAGGWVSTDVQRATNAMLVAGAWLGGIAIVAAMIIGPSLPQADARGLVDWRDVGDDDTRITNNPLVDIQSQLINLPNREVFTVQSDQKAYWRLMSLDEFNGRVWESSGSYDGADERLDTKYEGEISRLTIRQHFNITSLDSVWVPAAFDPRSLDTRDADVLWDKDTSTLIVRTSVDNSNGLSYDVVSELPNPDGAALAAASGPVPGDIQANQTVLPPDFSPRVRSLAEQLTAGLSSTYDKAIALQQYLRGFRYDLDVQIGQNIPAIEDFLFNVQAGYCQQFAGTFAAMARAVGLPTRVAVGYTTGEEDPNRPGLYHVLGKYAHAWPEVFIGGVGWVQFEPTPNRGAPNVPYTGVQEQQADPNDAGAAVTTPTSVVGPGDRTENSIPDVGDSEIPIPTEEGFDLARPKAESWWDRWGRHVAVGFAVLLGLVVIYAIAVPVAFAVRRRRRRARATEPVEQVRAAWAESVEAIGTLGVFPARSETAAEFATRSAPALGAGLLEEMAPSLEAAEYSVEGVTDDDAEAAWSTTKTVTTTVRHRATRQQRVMAALDPRPPDRRRRSPRRRGVMGVRTDAPAIEVVSLD